MNVSKDRALHNAMLDMVNAKNNLTKNAYIEAYASHIFTISVKSMCSRSRAGGQIRLWPYRVPLCYEGGILSAELLSISASVSLRQYLWVGISGSVECRMDPLPNQFYNSCPAVEIPQSAIAQ